MNNIILMDGSGNSYKAHILFTHSHNGKNYLVYLMDDDLLAARFNLVDNQYIIDNDLTEEEYDMIDKLIEIKLGDQNGE